MDEEKLECGGLEKYKRENNTNVRLRFQDPSKKGIPPQKKKSFRWSLPFSGFHSLFLAGCFLASPGPEILTVNKKERRKKCNLLPKYNNTKLKIKV